MFDLVVLVGPNDKDFIDLNIRINKKTIIGYRNVYIIPYDSSIKVSGCTTIDEKLFPFNIESISKILNITDGNPAWFLQQLLKLYAGFVIPDILDKYLVVDCDTLFIKKTNFIDNNDKMILTTCDEMHKPYFRQMNKLHNTLKRVNPKLSGISHHMLFDKKYIKNLFDMVKEKHNEEFYISFLKCIEPKWRKGSGASEYEIYFNYMLIYNPETITIRQLKNYNCQNKKMKLEDNFIEIYDNLSFHWYTRDNNIEKIKLLDTIKFN